MVTGVEYTLNEVVVERAEAEEGEIVRWITWGGRRIPIRASAEKPGRREFLQTRGMAKGLEKGAKREAKKNGGKFPLKAMKEHVQSNFPGATVLGHGAHATAFRIKAEGKDLVLKVSDPEGVKLTRKAYKAARAAGVADFMAPIYWTTKHTILQALGEPADDMPQGYLERVQKQLLEKGIMDTKRANWAKFGKEYKLVDFKPVGAYAGKKEEYGDEDFKKDRGKWRIRDWDRLTFIEGDADPDWANEDDPFGVMSEDEDEDEKGDDEDGKG